MVLNNYGLELKSTNLGNVVFIISERLKLNQLPIFKKMYIYLCLAAVGEGFISGCRKLSGFNGCFQKRLLIGQILVVVEGLLERWHISSWCQAFFNDLVKCDVINNNMCETFNEAILESRSKPIITMFKDIMLYVMTRMVAK